MYGQYSLLYLEASIQAYILERLKEFSTAISAQTLDLLIASSAAKRDAASSASTLDLLTALSEAMRSASISAAILDLLRAASVSSLVAASSAANLERLKTFSVATRSAATSASILDLLRAASVATSASILDLLSAASEAIRDAAISASTLDLLRELSASKAAKYLNRASDTSSRTCYILKMWEIKLFTPQQIQQKNKLLFIPIPSLSYQNQLLAFFNQHITIQKFFARKTKDQLIFFGFLNNHKLFIKVHCIQSNLIFSYKHMSNNEQIDPSIYLYDEIYDDIKGKQKEQKERDRSRSRSREKKNKLQQQKPKQSKYIGKMKQIMDNRRKDHETAFEKKIVRENQKLGVNQEMVFVTESYLQKKLEEKQAAKKKKLEQEQAERQAPQRGDYVNFKKKMLDQSSKYKH